MKDGFIKSAPHFFRLIQRSMLLLVVVLLMLAAWCPAPLQEAANPALTPNPVKSAWFLLWIQELVSWSRHMIWSVIALLTLLFLLPWVPGQVRAYHATWFGHGHRGAALIALLLFAVILALTCIAMFLRGVNWSLAF